MQARIATVENQPHLEIDFESHGFASVEPGGKLPILGPDLLGIRVGIEFPDGKKLVNRDMLAGLDPIRDAKMILGELKRSHLETNADRELLNKLSDQVRSLLPINCTVIDGERTSHPKLSRLPK